jgi:hypothetical protein
VLAALYREGGIPRLYSGVSVALVLAPLAKCGGIAANASTSGLPIINFLQAPSFLEGILGSTVTGVIKQVNGALNILPDQYFAKFMQTIHADSDLWVVQAMNPDWQMAAKPLQDMLAVIDRTILKMEDVNESALLELCKLGTCIYEHGWLYEKRPIICHALGRGSPECQAVLEEAAEKG